MPRLLEAHDGSAGGSTGASPTTDSEARMAPLEIKIGQSFRPFEGITLKPIDPEKSYPTIIAQREVLTEGISGYFNLTSITDFNDYNAGELDFPLGRVLIQEVRDDKNPDGKPITLPLRIAAEFHSGQRTLATEQMIVTIGKSIYMVPLDQHLGDEDGYVINDSDFDGAEKIGENPKREWRDIWLPMDRKKLAQIEVTLLPKLDQRPTPQDNREIVENNVVIIDAEDLTDTDIEVIRSITGSRPFNQAVDKIVSIGDGFMLSFGEEDRVYIGAEEHIVSLTGVIVDDKDKRVQFVYPMEANDGIYDPTKPQMNAAVIPVLTIDKQGARFGKVRLDLNTDGKLIKALIKASAAAIERRKAMQGKK